MRKKMFLLANIVALLCVSCECLTLQDRRARRTVKEVCKNSVEGRSYKSVAWGRVMHDDPFAGTGTQKFFSDITGTPPSPYSITHRLRMRNGFGREMTYDIRVFFTDEKCIEWKGMEYLANDDPAPLIMTK